MHGAVGPQKRRIPACGKVPYRVLGSFRSVNRIRTNSCRPDASSRLMRRYNQRDFRRLHAGIESYLEETKKRGFEPKGRVLAARLHQPAFDRQRPGPGSVCERVWLQQ